MPIYMKYGTITGEGTAEGFKGSEGWIEVKNFQFGVGRGITTPVGKGVNREASAPSVSEIVVTKELDVTSIPFFEAALWGTGVAVEFKFVKTGVSGGAMEAYAYVKLAMGMVSGYSVSNGGDRPTESISINFTKIEMGVTGQTEENKGNKAPKTGWSIAEGKQGTV